MFTFCNICHSLISLFLCLSFCCYVSLCLSVCLCHSKYMCLSLLNSYWFFFLTVCVFLFRLCMYFCLFFCYACLSYLCLSFYAIYDILFTFRCLTVFCSVSVWHSLSLSICVHLTSLKYFSFSLYVLQSTSLSVNLHLFFSLFVNVFFYIYLFLHVHTFIYLSLWMFSLLLPRRLSMFIYKLFFNCLSFCFLIPSLSVFFFYMFSNEHVRWAIYLFLCC